jgi:predicted DNA-binding transcriptional regulator AlpA
VPTNPRPGRRSRSWPEAAMAAANSTPPAPLATPAQVAEFTGLTEPQLAQLRYKGAGPVFIRLTSKAIRYEWSAVFDWVEQKRKSRT